MTNELIPTDLKFDVTVNTEITMHNEAQLNDIINEVEKKYTGLVFTEDILKEAKEARASLNKMSATVDDARKKVEAEYNEPLNAFKANIKSYIARLTDVTEPINESVKMFETKQKSERLVDVNTLISESAANFGIEPSEVVVQDSWLIKSLSKIKRTELVTGEMKRLQQEKEKKANELNVISSYCAALKIDDGGWLVQIENGETSANLMPKIDAYVKRENERIEHEKRQEEQRLAREKLLAEEKEQAERDKQSYQEEQKRIADESVVAETAATNESGNYTPPVEKVVVEQSVSDEFVLTLEFTMTREQQVKLSEFLTTEGIKVKKV